jgi:iron complex outermembrane receptor protein
VLIQPVERTNLVARGQFALAPSHTAFAEAVVSRSKATKQFEPYQITTSLATAYPVNGPYYQDLSAYIPSFDKTKPIAYRWRCTDCGKRTIETTTDGFRLLAGLEGTLFGSWDYKTGLSSAESKATSVLREGYLYTAPLNAALASGLVNPWLLPGQTQTEAAKKLLADASASGTRLFGGKSTTTELDGVISGEVAKLPAGPMALAVGFDLRKESYQFDDGSRTSQPVFLAPFDPQFPKVSRDIKALFAELAVPVVKGLEATLAVRHDKYSDFGDTTNPKVSLRWQPVEQFVLRGSYNTGFRAPSFFQLFTATTESQVPGNLADPVLCPNGPTAPGADLTVCAIRPNGRNGGNPNLQPEESKQWTLGFVVSPTDWLTATVDLWEIKRQNLIYELTPQQVIANYTTFPENLVRGANGRLDGPGGYIRAGFVNADGDITRGVDISVSANGKLGGGAKWSAWLDGTYMDSHRSRIFSSQPYVETVGQWSNRDLFVRWKHQLGFSYTRGDWTGALTQSYTSGYKDQKPAGTVPPGFDPDVKAYLVHNVSVGYTGIKNLSLNFGIKNLFDKDPPFTAHNLDFAAGAGWDPRVADPRGRAYTLKATYTFF